MKLRSKTEPEGEPALVVPEQQHEQLRVGAQQVINGYRTLVNSLIRGKVKRADARQLLASLEHESEKVLK